MGAGEEGHRSHFDVVLHPSVPVRLVRAQAAVPAVEVAVPERSGRAALVVAVASR